MKDNNIWSIVSLPPRKQAIGYKWVFKAKYNFDGSLERYKARLVTKDYTQKTGIDVTKTFSLVVKMVSVRSVLALTVAKWWNLFQMDVNNVFLQGDLDDEVYMDIPQGW